MDFWYFYIVKRNSFPLQYNNPICYLLCVRFLCSPMDIFKFTFPITSLIILVAKIPPLSYSPHHNHCDVYIVVLFVVLYFWTYPIHINSSYTIIHKFQIIHCFFTIHPHLIPLYLLLHIKWGKKKKVFTTTKEHKNILFNKRCAAAAAEMAQQPKLLISTEANLKFISMVDILCIWFLYIYL